MSDHLDETAADRQRRLDALHELARQTVTSESHEESESAPRQSTEVSEMSALSAAANSASTLAHLAADGARASRRRWKSAGAVVATLLIIGIVVGVAVRQGGVVAQIGQLGAQSAPTLAESGFAIPASVGVHCTGAPAWSPDSKHIAVFGQTNASPDYCLQYNNQTSIAQYGGGVFQSTNHPSGYVVVVLDSATGRVTQRIALPDLSGKDVCAGKDCSVRQPSLHSLSWTPDGRSVAIFFTYTLWWGNQAQSSAGQASQPSYVQPVGELILVRADASAPPRILIGAAPHEPASSAAAPGLPRYIWNLSTGNASTSAIPDVMAGNTSLTTPTYQWSPDGQLVQSSGDTTPFAPAYQWSPDGQINALESATAAPSAITPWRAGVVGQRRSATDPVLYRTSQWAWSRDGQFVTPDLDTSAYVDMSGVMAPKSGGAYTPPLVRAPGAALSAAVTSSLGSTAGVELTQSPDGKLLASYACTPDGRGDMSIRATKSATVIAHLVYTYPLTFDSLDCTGGIGDIIWSPDGSRIALSDNQDAQVIVWRVNVAQ